MAAGSHTSRMTRLLGAFRRERNGLVADTMHYDGARYGLNYGVNLPTVRSLVRENEPIRDEAFARFLVSQQVRCLQLAALHLADPAALVDSSVADFWLSKLQNSELAEEAAYALLARTATLDELLERALNLQTPLYARYALLLAAARQTTPSVKWLHPTLQLLQAEDHRLIRQAVTTLWAQIANSDETQKRVVLEHLSVLGTTPSECYLKEELAWRIL